VNKIAVNNDKIAKFFFIILPLVFRLYESDFVARNFWIRISQIARIEILRYFCEKFF
jgi:hypothetical protein